MSFSPDPAQGKHVFDLDRQYVFHSWSAQGALNPMCIAAAEGSYVWDYDGNKWLDFSSQLVNVNIGHQHPKARLAFFLRDGECLPSAKARMCVRRRHNDAWWPALSR